MSSILVTPMSSSIDEILRGAVDYREEAIVDLGVTSVLIRTNVPNFSGFRYFSRLSEPRANGHAAPYELCCVDLDHAPSLDESMVRDLGDTSFRGQRFRSGFYLTHHFGAPATLITLGNRHYIIGRDLGRIIWGWYTKYILTVHSLSVGSLHLKAGCFALDGAGTLLIGRGSGGKTVLLTQLCQEGATFVSNTHAIVDSQQVANGVPTTLRVRDDACFGALVKSGRLQSHLERSEFIADPATLFARSAASARIRNICIVDFHAGTDSVISAVDTAAAYDIFEQFGFPINTYGMKDDVLEFYHGDLTQFINTYETAKRQLRELVHACSCFYVNCDMMVPQGRARLRAALRNQEALKH
jgi:hypothetical protein